MKFPAFLLAFVLWLAAAIVRIVFILVGFVAVALSLVGDGKNHTPWLFRIWANIDHDSDMTGWSTWDKYKWFAFRNPTPGLSGLIKQPIPPTKSPDDMVRKDPYVDSASRLMWSFPFFEYWYLKEIDIGNFRYFEWRFGWKFSEKGDKFVPIFQIGPRSS